MRFLPGYPQDIEPGAGHSPLPGRRCVILHRTETPKGSGAVVRNSWRGSANWAKGLSHFIGDGGSYIQLLPLDVCAYTSKGGPDAANKAGCPIQIEITGYSRDDFDDEEYEALSKWLADLCKAGIEIDLSDEASHPRFYGPDAGFVLASTNSPLRNFDNWGGFANYNGITAHQFLRGNDHWDVGDKDIRRILRRARELTGSDSEEDELMAIKDELWAKLDLMSADLAIKSAESVEATRVHLDQQIKNIETNLAGLIRGVGVDVVEGVLAGVELPDGVAAADLADRIVAGLAERVANG